MDSPKIYTAEDVSRYHRGELSAAEMHRLEKAALDDPMLADALEGYKHTTTVSADLQALQNRLQERINDKKERKDSWLLQPWAKMAAAFILMAGAGWLVWQTLSPTSSDIASVTEKTYHQQNPGTVADSATTTQNLRRSPQEENLQAEPEAPVTANKSTGKQSAAGTVRPSAPASRIENTSAASAETEINALAADVNRADEAASNRNTLMKQRAAVDSVADQELARQGANTGREAQARTRMAPPVSAEPKGGWTAFEKYVKDNQRAVDILSTKKAAAYEVELVFRIDKNGRPKDIKIAESLCYTCDEEAIRLLKEGPDWKGPDTAVKIRIQLQN